MSPLHVMVDIETFSTNPKAVVTQIAMVPFTKDEVFHTKALNVYVEIQPQLDVGREVNANTLLFWLEQSEHARTELADGLKRYSVSPRDAMTKVFTWPSLMLETNWKSIAGVWSKSPQFDITILESLFRDFGREAPWTKKFRTVRDVRAYADFLPADHKSADLTGFEHEAVYDCLKQIETVQAVMKAKT